MLKNDKKIDDMAFFSFLTLKVFMECLTVNVVKILHKMSVIFSFS